MKHLENQDEEFREGGVIIERLRLPNLENDEEDVEGGRG